MLDGCFDGFFLAMVSWHELVLEWFLFHKMADNGGLP